ncbi:hypothetical protein CHUAL_000203 [Chamberlinius hualienensis]
MKTFVCLIALFLSVNAELTYQPIDNQCSNLPTKGTIDLIVGFWLIETWSEKAIRCGTLNYTKDDTGDIYTGVYTYYEENDTKYQNKVVIVDKYVPDPANTGRINRATQYASTPFRNVAVIFANPNSAFYVIGCDFVDGSTESYAAAYYKPTVDQATKDQLQADITGDFSGTLYEVYQGSDCPPA